ncbi:MAG: sigma-70 family RNA polymerase sigma factor [Polyangiaceae bacterium]
MLPTSNAPPSFRPPSDPPSGVRLRHSRFPPPEDNDFSAFAKAQRKRLPSIARWARVPRHVAEDMLQWALVSTWKAWKRGERPHPSGWPPWLEGALLHQSYKYWRSKKRAAKYEAKIACHIEHLHPQTRSPEDLALLAEAMHEICAAVGRLAPERREVAALYLFEKLPMPEVGARLGIPWKTAANRWRLARADIGAAWARDREKERFPLAMAAFLSSAGAFLLAFWRRFVGRDRRRDRTGAVLACASLAFVLCCHDALRPVQRADSAFSSVFGAVASVQGLLPQPEPANVEPSPAPALPASGKGVLSPSAESLAGSSKDTGGRPALSGASDPLAGIPEDVLIRLAAVALRSDRERSRRLLREHARRFGSRNATARRLLLIEIDAANPPAIAPSLEKR